MRVNKEELKAELVRLLEHEHDTLAAAQRATTEGLTHEDARPESDKDTRATEASYLARGQAKRVMDLRADLERVRAMRLGAFDEDDRISLSALVTVEDGSDGGRLLWIAPAGGGQTLSHEGERVSVVTPQSPMGRALVNARSGDVVEVQRAGRKEELEILDVR